MKTIRGFFNLPYLLLAGFFFAGCYTQMESVGNEGSDRRNGDKDDYAYSDSTNNQDSGGAAVDNYFNDDGYRSMRYQTSFHYYYPSRHMWSTSIWFDPWYDDFCMYPWDPWYRPGLWYPTIAYPYPYWYPGWGYYPHYGPTYGYGNWRGNNYPLYGTTVEPGRRRTTGSTRGDDGNVRTRGGVTAPTTIPVASGTASERTRTRTVGVPDAAPATTDADRSARRRTRNDVPWWERTKTQNPPERSRATERARAADDKARAVDRKRVEERAKNQNDKNKPQARQRDKREQTPQSKSVDRERRNREPSVRQAPRQETPRYSPPTRESGRSRSGNDGGNRSSGGERTRRDEK